MDDEALLSDLGVGEVFRMYLCTCIYSILRLCLLARLISSHLFLNAAIIYLI